jgi:phenylacetate-CoA ligase
MEQAFKTRVTDTYGCAEGIQIAAQCCPHDPYLVHSLDVVVEYLDEEGHAVPPGQPGNLVVTRLHPGPMPLIRYRIGDVGIGVDNRQSACGRGFELMESIQGRDTDVVITPSGNRLIVHFFTGILEHFPEIDSFQVVQEEADAMLVRIVPTTEITPDSASRIVASLQEKGAADMRIEIEPVQEIPLASTGKRRFVISKVARALKEKA